MRIRLPQFLENFALFAECVGMRCTALFNDYMIDLICLLIVYLLIWKPLE